MLASNIARHGHDHDRWCKSTNNVESWLLQGLFHIKHNKICNMHDSDFSLQYAYKYEKL